MTFFWRITRLFHWVHFRLLNTRTSFFPPRLYWEGRRNFSVRFRRNIVSNGRETNEWKLLPVCSHFSECEATRPHCFFCCSSFRSRAKEGPWRPQCFGWGYRLSWLQEVPVWCVWVGALCHCGIFREFTGLWHCNSRKLKWKKPRWSSRYSVPAGSEFLCRKEFLGVPGALDGRSHVVSARVREKGKENSDIKKVIPITTLFVILLTVLETALGNHKKKWSTDGPQLLS